MEKGTGKRNGGHYEKVKNKRSDGHEGTFNYNKEHYGIFSCNVRHYRTVYNVQPQLQTLHKDCNDVQMECRSGIIVQPGRRKKNVQKRIG